ncbi:apolipoprotein N-acyltransferase [Candidatus Magnetomonas plexicatena]|uniref:apolipoprotein N-acyltransferase n=1 Tax=Candidatus Magnetomonas plexicatena TaxID=2552947 RepID=UPI001C797295|nr:apolipoprotein N-acyltransferase [Nitrospirales bacterium LBB_01]
MIKKLNSKTFNYLMPSLSGVLLFLAFPKPELSSLAWAALLPLFYSVTASKDKLQAIFSGLITGLFFFFGTQYWIYHSLNHFGGIPFILSLILVFLLCLYQSLYIAVFAIMFWLIKQRWSLKRACYGAPFIWVCLEYLKGIIITGFPWSFLGYSQYKFIHLIQISDITSVYGVSFLIVFFNSALFLTFFETNSNLVKKLKPIFIVSLLLVLTVLYGVKRQPSLIYTEKVTVALVQGNIPQEMKLNNDSRDKIIGIYETLTLEKTPVGTDLVVWPESSLPFYFMSEPTHTEHFINFQKRSGKNLLFGTDIIRGKQGNSLILTNSAVLLDKDGKIVYVYDKIHMVPFGEYVPLRKLLFFVDKLVGSVGEFSPGTDYMLARVGFTDGRVAGVASFGTHICYEIIFPDLVRKFYRNGGDFIVTISNDAWFGNTSGPYQHLAMAVFRAVENGKYLIRATNTGISAIVGPNGRILQKTSLFERAVLTGDIYKSAGNMTFYTVFGDIFAYVCLIYSIILAALLVIKRR